MLGASQVLPIFQSVREAFQVVLQWITAVVKSFVQSNGVLHNLLPLFVISIGIAVLLVGIAIIKKVVWGS